MPKVLIADKLSPAALAIFKERGVDADVKTGLSKEELLKIVDQYDGIAIRSAIRAGWLNGGGVWTMPCPRRMFFVRCDAAARNTSGALEWEYSSRKWCSTSQA